jgi:hypothetical protein
MFDLSQPINNTVVFSTVGVLIFLWIGLWFMLKTLKDSKGETK